MSIVIVHALGLFTPGWVHHYAFPDLGCSVGFNPDPGFNSQVPFQSMETIGRNSEVGGVRGDTRVFLPGGSSLGGHTPGLQLPQDRPVWVQALGLPTLSLLALDRLFLLFSCLFHHPPLASQIFHHLCGVVNSLC